MEQHGHYPYIYRGNDHTCFAIVIPYVSHVRLIQAVPHGQPTLDPKRSVWLIQSHILNSNNLTNPKIAFFF